jgi:hypothetical protein
MTGTGSVAMSVSPTFTGTVGAADVTTTGNTILGNASTDTLNVGNGGLVKDASGNVGIGASPVASLQVSKLTTVLSGTGNAFGVYVYPTSSGACYIDALTATVGSTDLSLRTYNNGTYNAFIGTASGGTATIFKVGGTERMRISSTGNVGIGTAIPTQPLDVNGNVAITGTLGVTGVATFSAGTALLPAITTTGDTNTGLWFPAADTVAASTGGTERMRIDSVGNTYVETGNLWQYSPAPTALAAGANAGTAAQLRSGMFSAAQTTAVTLTMPTGTAIDTGFAAPAVDIGFYFYVINTGSALGDVTVAVNTGVTSLGSLVVAVGTSAQFRLRRTLANTYIMYRLS